MDATFITIHDLSEDARILYSSDSIVDILGYTPDEVVNRSIWDWFHPDEVPLAKLKHKHGVALDKAAVLAYARIKNRQGDYVGCECCFSVVYDVLVCCTSIYRHGSNSLNRANAAPMVRRRFAHSPKDPRYHMLTTLSSKFSLGEEEQTHEPRAALFLNRYTRSLTIMYATSGIEEIIGVSSEEMKGKSFYFCIQEECLGDAVRCLESAKGNDSIAYLRFRFRDPRTEDPPESTPSESEDDIMTDVTGSEDESEDTGTRVTGDSSGNASSGNEQHSSTHASGDSSTPGAGISSGPLASPGSEAPVEHIELEAVISCTTDGLVVILRKARPALPDALFPVAQPPQHVFAAPWAQEPVFQPAFPHPNPFPLGAQHPAIAQAGPPPAHQLALMRAIRDVAVFAWGLTGINGCLVDYAKGTPRGDSQPADGLPIWTPDLLPPPVSTSGYGPRTSSSGNDPSGDPGLS